MTPRTSGVLLETLRTWPQQTMHSYMWDDEGIQMGYLNTMGSSMDCPLYYCWCNGHQITHWYERLNNGEVVYVCEGEHPMTLDWMGRLLDARRTWASQHGVLLASLQPA